MRKISFLAGLTFTLCFLIKVLAVDVSHYTLTPQSPNQPSAMFAETNLTPRVSEFTYDAALTNIGVDAPRDDCISEGDDLIIWVKVHNAGYEIVDCAEVAFTLNGVEFDRVHVAGLYPGEVRKYSATASAPPGCEPYTIDAHIDWPPDENPDNDDIEDIFATAEEADTLLRHDNGVCAGAWTWPPCYCYPEHAVAAKYQMPVDGILKYWDFYYTNTTGYPSGHIELFVWAADTSGYPIDYGTGGLYDMELQTEEIYWPDFGFVCYPICMPVTEGEHYFFGYCNRQSTMQFFCYDDYQDNPDWNWYRDGGVWYPGNLYDGDFWVHVYMDMPGVQMTCETLTPVFCRGKNFYFKVTVENTTGGNISGPMAFSGYSGYDCDPGNVLATLRRNRNFAPGVTEAFYFLNVPNAIAPGQYSASVAGILSGYELFCCMNSEIVQCEPWRMGGSANWELIEVDRRGIALPTVTELHQNYPNPFNAVTNISYTLAEAGNVTLRIYDIAGRLMVTLLEKYQEAGRHQLIWDGSGLSSGVYFCKLQASESGEVKKMNLLK